MSFFVECGFGYAPTDAAIRWTDVTHRFMAISGRDGRNTEFDRIETGQATLVFDNTDGDWTPGRDWLPAFIETFGSLVDPGASPVKVNAESGYGWCAVAGTVEAFDVLPAGGVRIEADSSPAAILGPTDAAGLAVWQPIEGNRYQVRVIARAARMATLALTVYASDQADGTGSVPVESLTRFASGTWDILTIEFAATAHAYHAVFVEAGGTTLDVLTIEVSTPNPFANALVPGVPVRAYNVLDGNLLHFGAVNPAGEFVRTPRWHGDGPIGADGDDAGPYFTMARGDEATGRTAIFRAGVNGNADLIQVSEGDTVVINADVRAVGDSDVRLIAEFVGLDGGVSLDAATAATVSSPGDWESLEVTHTVPRDGWVRPAVTIGPDDDDTVAHVRNVKVRVNDPGGSPTVAPVSGVVPLFRGFAERWFAEQDGQLSTLRMECVDALGLLASPAPSFYRMVAIEQARLAVTERGARSAYYWPCVEDAESGHAHAAFGDVDAAVRRSPNSNGEYIGGFVSDRVFDYSDGEESGAFDVAGGDDKTAGAALIIHGPDVPTILDDRGIEIAMWVKWKSLPTDSEENGRVLAMLYSRNGTTLGKLEIGGSGGTNADQMLVMWWYGEDDDGQIYWSSGASDPIEAGRPYLIRFGIRRVPGGLSSVFVAVNDQYYENPVTYWLESPVNIGEIVIGTGGMAPYDLVPTGLEYSGHVDALISHVWMVNGLVGVPFWKDAFERVYDNGLGHAGEVEGAPVLAVADSQTYDYADPARWRVRNGRAEVAPTSPGTPELLAIGQFDELGPTDFGGTFRVGTTVPLSSITNGVALRVYARQWEALDRSTGLTLELRFASDGAVSIGAAINDVTPSVTSTGRTVTSSAPADVWVRFQIRGRLVRVVFWENGQPEPGPDTWYLNSLIPGISGITGYTVIFGFVAESLPEQWLMWMDDLDLWGSDYWGNNLSLAWARHVDAFLGAVGPTEDGNTGWVADEDTRIRELLRHFGWTAGALIDEGLAELIAARWNNNTPWLQLLQDAAEWAGGVFFAGAAGEVAYHNRHHRGGAPRWTLTEHASGEWMLDLARLANVVRVERSTGAARMARNEASVRRYTERPVTLRRDVTSETLLKDMAEHHAFLYGDASPWCQQVTVDGTTAGDDEALRALALGGSVSDALRLIGLPSSAPESVADAFIEGRQYAAEVDGPVLKWETTFTVSPARLAGAWILGDPITSVLGACVVSF